MERIRSVKKAVAQPDQDPPARAKPAPRSDNDKSHAATDWGRAKLSHKLGSVPIHYRSKATSVPDMQEMRRYYAGVIQIAYVEFGTKKIVLHVIDNPMIQSSYVLFRESDLIEKINALLTDAEG